MNRWLVRWLTFLLSVSVCALVWHASYGGGTVVPVAAQAQQKVTDCNGGAHGPITLGAGDSNTVIQRCRFEHLTTRSAIVIDSASNVTIRDNVFSEITSDPGVDAHAINIPRSGHQIAIQHNVFANIGADGVQLGDEGADIADVFIVGDNQFSVTRAGVGENGVDVKATAGNVVVAGNRFHGFRPCPPGGQKGCTGSNGEAIVVHVSPAGGATGVTIERNRIWNNSAGVVVGQDVPSNQSPFPSGIAIRNNWIYAHQSAGLVIAPGRTAGISVLHNTFLDNDRHVKVETDPASVTCANNLLAGTGRAAPAPCAATTNPYFASTTAVRFVDPDAAPERDLHLGPESPAVDVATPIPAVRDDIDGEARPPGAAADFGADEANGQPPPAPPEPHLRLLPLAQRLADTRPGSGYQGAGQPLVGLADPRCYQVAGLVRVPGDATGVLANLTAVGHSTDGWITAFPAGAPIPTRPT
jgi:hypothetical protein